MPLIEANGVQLHYDLAGPEGAPVVACSNSLGTTLEMWDAQVPALLPRYRVLRYDTRGHGRSPVVDRPCTVEDLAADLAGLLDALGIERPHVVGLSLGGMTAQAFAVRYPGRARSLVLMATSPHMPTPEAWAERIALVRAQGMAALGEGMMTRWFTTAFPLEQPERLAAVRERFVAIEPRGYAVLCGAIGAMDLRLGIGAITEPTLIIAGADDPATPVSHSEDIRSRVPHAEMAIVPRAAHLIAVERPEIVNTYLTGFLDRQEGRAALPTPTAGATFEAGLANRKAVLGAEHVERSLAKAGAFAGPWQDFITRTAWGEIWGDTTLPWRTRSLVTLAMMVALGREEEFKLHVRPALRNGVTVEELRALLLQSAIYAGVPAANGAFRWVKEVLGDELD